MSRSMRSFVSRTTTAIWRRSRSRASGSESVTSSSVRTIASGVRSSCEALATKRRWLSKAPSRRAEHRVEDVGELAQLVARAPEPDALVQGALRDRARGGRDPRDRPQRARPATTHPARPTRRHRGQRDREESRTRRSARWSARAAAR